ncbi:hypothetical protein TSOC_011770 [Tetrabaena socialis]|uniref:Uncharacterized protein n=1 Tax=Tetrabaena socialis TaxID=47790 RepID=A0A2J7ZPS4_9CHLO|nr:hypothetical protein TSOC_011770 [Tetrabaena socialis]|eukprot:PNH02252.1 hypothetical protein TSOC_011770 [Tetrabaena socialis]
MWTHFLATCAALLVIVEQRLFTAAGFTSFKAYVRSSGRLDLGVRQAQHLVAAARFVRLLPAGSALPSCERHVRPLTGHGRTWALAAWELTLRRSELERVPVCGALVAQCLHEVSAGAAGRPRGTGPWASDDTSGSDGGSTARRGSAFAEGCGDVAECGGGGGGGADAAGAHGRTHPPGACVVFSSGSLEWYTPEPVLQLVREVFAPGRIDLDPCSSASANARVQAGRFFDERADGLAPKNEWSGNVFSNPPFGMRGGRSMQGLFVERCEAEYRGGRITQAVLLLKSAVGYAWFSGVMQWPVCFVGTRMAFVKEEQGSSEGGAGQGPLRWGVHARNPHGSMVAYMGPHVVRFAEVFSRIGSVPGASSWALGARPAPIIAEDA